MTPRERKVIDLLVQTWNSYLDLCDNEGSQHPNDMDDFANGIHDCEKIIALRIARREDPDTFIIRM
jgi:hypothetical protein